MPRRPDIKGKGKDTGDQKVKEVLPRRSTRRRFHDVEGTGTGVPLEAQSKRMRTVIQGAESTLKGLGDSSQKDPTSGDLTRLSSNKGNKPSQISDKQAMISDEQAIAELSLKYIQEKGREALSAHIEKTITDKSKKDLAKTQLDHTFISIYDNLRTKKGEERINAINEYLDQEGSSECFIFKRLVRKKKEELAEEQRYIHDGIPIDTTKLTPQRLERLSEMNDAIYNKSKGMSNPEILAYYRKIINHLDRIIKGESAEESEAPKDPNEALFQVFEAIKQPPGVMKNVTVKLLERYADEIKGWMGE